VRLTGPILKSVDITGISCDSRTVRAGHLFAALPGVKVNGAEYAKQAAARGAAAILAEHPEPLTDLPQLVCADARMALAQIARTFYGEADLRLRLGAVTGTNGKSTTAYLVRHLLRAHKRRCGMLGTIEYDLGSESIEAPLTTPESLDLHRYLRTMVDAGCDSAFMETSSHSLHQRRVSGIHFETAVFTNLTQDHLDYHRTMEAYRDAKALLFRDLLPDATAIVNADDPSGAYFAKVTQARVLRFTLDAARNGNLEIVARPKSIGIHGTVFELSTPWGRREINMKLAGAHNIQNAVGAIAATVALGGKFDVSCTALENFAGVPGRLEAVGLPSDNAMARKQGFRVFVDYAHTDDALRSVMRALRELKPSRLLVVFGCGGDRDRGKRPLMAKAVEELADLGFVTSDNPRTEDPEAILCDVCKGIRQPAKFTVQIDRARAIAQAIGEARSNDVVLIAGKGHENYQIVGTEKRHFSDVEQAQEALYARFA
jgi:UDP-N-acetylmuramoyl-L-alanyl-D-glutamate--2,6-diaminopimelate ligase